jgi:periplasmic copper chaperone A
MRFLRLITLVSFFVLGPIGAYAHEVKVGDIEITHPWARATPKGAGVGGGYMTITNHGNQPDRLTAVSSPIASMAQLHTMVMEGDVAKMRELPGGIEIPPGARIELKPQSLHIMFMGLKKQLNEKESFEAELTFEKAGKVTVEFEIEPIGADASMDSMDMNME